MAWRKNFTEIFTYRLSPCLDGVDIAYAQTGLRIAMVIIEF